LDTKTVYFTDLLTKTARNGKFALVAPTGPYGFSERCQKVTLGPSYDYLSDPQGNKG